LEPGTRHWKIVERLCIDCGAKGNLIPDAYLAAPHIATEGAWLE
jgi:hypothetical protein